MPEEKAPLLHHDVEDAVSEVEHDTDTTPPVASPYPDGRLVAETEKPGHLRRSARPRKA